MDKETILVVDDNPQIAKFLVNELLPSLGYHCIHAPNGYAALELLRRSRVSLMLLDLQLPDMTGLDVLRQLVRDGYSVPTILLTAHGSEQIAAESFRLGVQDYLIKPVDTDRLNDSITRALTESRLRREKAALTMQLREQLSWQSVLGKVGQSVTSSLELDDVLKRIVEAGVQITRAEEGFLALLDEQTDKLFLRAAKNIDQEKSKTMRLPVTDSLIATVLKTGKPVRTTSESSQEPLIKISTGFFVHSLLHVPIISRGKNLGVLTMVNHSHQKPFKEKDEALLISLAGYAAIALDNAALYERAQQEIVERRRVEDALRVSEERYELAMRGSNEGLWDWDLRVNKIYFSPRWNALLGLKLEETSDNPSEWFSRVHVDDIENLRSAIQVHLSGATAFFENEHRMLHYDGTYHWMLSRGLSVFDSTGTAYRIAGSIADITDRKYAEQKLLQYAFYDKLTGLPNRALFIDHLSLAIERAKRRADYRYAVLFMDLDRFKDINDSLGHMVGDDLLLAVGRLLQTRLRSTDTVARFGGDEFVILLEDLRQAEDSLQVSDWIHSALASPFYLHDNEAFVTASIGIVYGDSSYQRPEDVLRDADIAMYHAKSNGKSRYEVFDPSMRTRILDRLELASDLRRAIENKELRVYYQIIESLTTGQITGVEALVRWQHPQRGLLLPRDFIPLAEDTGLIIDLDRWVTLEACRQFKEWQMENPSFANLTISVNISGKQFVQADLVDFIERAIVETGINPSQLSLEITESVIIENKDRTIEICTRLQQLGVQIEIDDFGIGYSSLSYLSQFPVNALKIDRSFISKMTETSNETNIIQAILMLSHRMGVGVIAEGVETANQIQQLRNLGCEFVQGFYVSRPVAALDTKKLVTGWLGGDAQRAIFLANKTNLHHPPTS
jgi:diguanylate cyclase (GGDEF)-like protein/PAS domain S-box-containing protein